ncbi:GNAT family N-acetyltransferase [Pseudomonas rubra]|uniref:GNAT family N-acetyltransferase n=1 Tax=Pseudomonas rubra TaxID=2942627 RepID=A0ABT5PEC5_9PSED|nr:GNAT family N-acetyltransferase [Pseudomonas rubra]MDD1016552.1 GNAT family N-acetyltransferase [Pseudomonas rubra]MDD1039153.1 GNAT family N-acetyltransferase [Pseudomonas rubra]MDD1157979.1 GNAT family N-acetyltransferase [Pseudomonas rubra]
MKPAVRPATIEDTQAISALHREAFVRQQASDLWVQATLSAYPRLLPFVLVLDGQIAGYIFWAQKSGIRPAATLELDQIAIAARHQGHGYGEHLIRESLALATASLHGTGQTLKSILVSTRADNAAQRLYAKVLGAKVVASIEGLYSATEVIMLADMTGGTSGSTSPSS